MGLNERAQGLLRVNATLGFGRSHIAPLIAEYVKKFPQVDIQLQLSVNPPAITDDAYDVCFRFGHPPDSRTIAKLIAPNKRILAASPSYIKKHGEPKSPNDLIKHNCIGIRQGDEGYGLWRFSNSKGKSKREFSDSVKVRGNLTTNDGGIAVNWALDGNGIVLRAEWDVSQHIKSGKLIQVMKNYETPDANIYAVYAERHKTSVRVKTLIDFAIEAFGEK